MVFMEATAKAKFARYSYRKVGQVLDLIRGKKASEAMNILMFLVKSPSGLVIKTLKSAIANAGRLKNPDTVYVKKAWVTMGPPIKRMRAGSLGRGNPYKRKMCHLTIVVGDTRGG
ncbi:MAG: 50S ribosomal protein L22 [Elusimicrobia bacterium ADurb.Bin231]|nr:MAG: 50S ribosomal protein L22 [Elusimicrobia bacterium ADurb.Bin231]